MELAQSSTVAAEVGAEDGSLHSFLVGDFLRVESYPIDNRAAMSANKRLHSLHH